MPVTLHPLQRPGTESIWSILSSVTDPEVPVLTILDLGIVRDVRKDNGGVTVSITPTYSGCPAMDVIASEIRSALHRHGFREVTVKHVLFPPWTTDWLSEEGREKLRKYGIAPPEHTTAEKAVLLGRNKTVTCPRCGSVHTEMISQFGSTACKALWKCKDCKEPFDYFKCI
jgi:ring-1,2-phenylacetyl-CoA epoxidase subunit PaaD